MLKTVAMAAPAAVFAGRALAAAAAPSPEFAWLNQTAGPRPEHGWENWEALLDGDLSLAGNPAAMTAPELAVFVDRSWVFNRAMEWRRAALDGCVICYSSGGSLRLTGAKGVSEWHSDPANLIEAAGDMTRFVKRSARRCRDAAVLPAFQFHLGQHPRLELEVAQADAEWQFCASVKGRGGPPLFSSGWRKGPGRASWDVAEELKRIGQELSFAELHFAMVLWTDSAAAGASVTFQLGLPAQPALVAALPVIRHESVASRGGAPVAAVLVDAQGRRLDAKTATVTARLGILRAPLQEQDGYWKGLIPGLKPGDYRVRLESAGALQCQADLWVRITQGEFPGYDVSRRSFTFAGRVTGPLTGGRPGLVFFRGKPGAEEMAQGKLAPAPGDRPSGWEALTERELDTRMRWFAKNGWDALVLDAQEGTHERLDAGGRIAPRGAEHLALVLRVAADCGLKIVQSLGAAPAAEAKGRPGTAPWRRYVEPEGKPGAWTRAGGPFDGLFQQYAADFAAVFKDETALLAVSAWGRGDAEAGAARCAMACEALRKAAPKRLVLAEALGAAGRLPAASEGWPQDLLGAHTHEAGLEIPEELDLGIFYKTLLMLPNGFHAAGLRAPSGLRAAFERAVLGDASVQSGFPPGDPRLRRRLRDILYLGLAHRMPMTAVSEEVVFPEEREVWQLARRQADWDRLFLAPKVAVRVDESCLKGPGRRVLAEYEKALARLPLACLYVAGDNPPPDGVLTVLDARKPFVAPRFAAAGGTMPDELGMFMPLRVSEGYQAAYAWSADQQLLAAYVYNCAGQSEAPFWRNGRLRRAPAVVPLRVQLQNLAVRRHKLQVFDLDRRRRCVDEKVRESYSINLGRTDRDYLVLVCEGG